MKKVHLINMLILALTTILVIQCNKVQELQDELSSAIKGINGERLSLDIPKIKHEKFDQLSVKFNDDFILEMDNIQSLSDENMNSSERLEAVNARFIIITDSDTGYHEVLLRTVGNDKESQYLYVEATDSTLLRSNLADHTIVGVTSRTTTATGMKVINVAGSEDEISQVLQIGNLPSATYIELEAAYIKKRTDTSNPVNY